MHSTCQYYDAVNERMGRCRLKLYGGKTISPGVCLLACSSFSGNEAVRAAMRRNVTITVRGVDPATGKPFPLPVATVRWLGIDWIGKPFPLRLKLRRRWPFVHVEDHPGCGCIMRLKMLWMRLRKRQRKGCGCQTSRST